MVAGRSIRLVGDLDLADVHPRDVKHAEMGRTHSLKPTPDARANAAAAAIAAVKARGQAKSARRARSVPCRRAGAGGDGPPRAYPATGEADSAVGGQLR
jgi:hypothetical protein